MMIRMKESNECSMGMNEGNYLLRAVTLNKKVISFVCMYFAEITIRFCGTKVPQNSHS